MKLLVSLGTIAKVAGVDQETIRRRVKAGKLYDLPDQIKIGREVYYAADETKLWLVEHELPTFDIFAPPSGWKPSPEADGFFCKNIEVVSEKQLRERLVNEAFAAAVAPLLDPRRAISQA